MSSLSTGNGSDRNATSSYLLLVGHSHTLLSSEFTDTNLDIATKSRSEVVSAQIIADPGHMTLILGYNILRLDSAHPEYFLSFLKFPVDQSSVQMVKVTFNDT